MSFNELEWGYIKMFKEINADFVIRFTPKFRMCDSVVEGRIMKMSICLLNKGYVCRGFIVKDYGKISGLHFHSTIRLDNGNIEMFKDDFIELLGRFGFNGFIENYKDGGYEEYMVTKLKYNENWVGLWEN